MTESPKKQKFARAPFTGRLSTIADRNRTRMLFDISVIPAALVAFTLAFSFLI